MGSHTNWLDLAQQERDDLGFVIGDAVASVDVFRRTQQGGVAGLTAETVDPEYLRTTTARIDTYDTRTALTTTSRPVALTSDRDVQLDDLWRLIDVANRIRWYRVAQITPTRYSSSVALEEVKR